MSTTPETTSTEAAQSVDATEAAAAPATSVKERAKTSREGKDIHLTDKAADKIKEILKNDNHPDTMYLYVGVKGGGCSGLTYVLDLRDEASAAPKETDEVFESHGIPIVSDLKSYVVGNMTGTTIDYQDGLTGAGFVFNNPNAKHSCGCGSSYSA